MSTTAPMCEPKGLLRDIMSYQGRNGLQPGSTCSPKEKQLTRLRDRSAAERYALPDGAR